MTCGSVVKMANSDTNVRLHSHEVKYGSGSGQQVSDSTPVSSNSDDGVCVCALQSVTGAKFVDDVNSYWVVKAGHKESCDRG